MPPMTPIRTFLDSLASGQTNITKRLKQIFDNIDPNDPVYISFMGADLSQDLPNDVQVLLDSQGLSTKEIKHINDWPPQPKEDARTAINAAVTAVPRITLEHRWGLTHGPDPVTDSPSAANNHTLTYLSSQQKLTPALWAALGDVKIEA